MKLTTHLKEIKRLARARRDENYDFRAYLKELPYPVRKIDRVVQDTARTVTAQIDCAQCANCCKEMMPVLGKTDIRRLARFSGLSIAAFSSRFLKSAPGNVDGMVFKRRPCPFLKDNRCAVYEARPGDCRSYPHLHRREFVYRTLQAINNCSVCPIVFNTYEILKTKLATRIRAQRE